MRMKLKALDFLKRKSEKKNYYASVIYKRNNKKFKSRNFLKRKFPYLFKFFRNLFKFFKERFVAVLFFLSILFLYLFLKTNFFVVNQITFVGVKQIPKEKLEAIAKNYKGKNIYSVNLSDIEKDVYNSSVYVDYVYAKKFLPSKIVINIEEKNPFLIILNFDGVYLIDSNGEIIANPIQDKISFDSEELEIITTNNLELEIVKNRIIANASDKEIYSWLKDDVDKKDIDFDNLESKEIKELLDYSKIDEGLKKRTFDEIRNEIFQIINEHFAKLNEQINTSDYASLQRVEFYQNYDFKNGDKIDWQYTNCMDKILTFFDKTGNYSIKSAVWKTQYSFEVSTIENKTFVFGLNRAIDEQIYDLETILKILKEQSKDFNKIDVRSKIIAIS